jgi:nucleoside-diphosphate-sugar epimerase
VLYLSIVWSDKAHRIYNYKNMLAKNYIANKNIDKGLYNLVHTYDVSSAIILAIKQPLNFKYDEYIVSTESIKYIDFLSHLEKIFSVARKANLLLCKINLCKKIFTRMGLRIPFYYDAEKEKALGCQINYSSNKIRSKLKWVPKKYFIEEFDGHSFD